ncbi:putative L,D-transpeptidase ErfK/SrfK [Defluviimonas aquaemixtae]|uniref:Putative L,D-transpeptidase ErfK/SrfK n=1 Tax=Albidovulum aquaemixtae TaxID=1542388 RepID=A0A2R8BMD1_9RHOB|nr:L,D-transpeptidase [Defluviimonas aquaemixtae]SPH24494.1 putative L,D-transpeptidase ErfK/SrfK [Defluviimonas aquaemixtae]
MPVSLRALSRIRSATILPVILLIAACGGQPEVTRAPVAAEPLRGYEAVQDGDILIPEVHPGYTNEHNRRIRVAWTGAEGPGTIVVDPWARWLYYVEEGGTAIRYGIAVGREGRGFRGNAVIKRKEEWPFWRPTANMIRTEPEHYAQFADGLEGGLDNPLGARALYLYRGGRDTKYRIHGTNASQTIGRRTSAGCIRLFNQDALDLYQRAPMGTPVVVRTPEESLAIEGAFVELENGYLVPEGSLEAEEFYQRQSVATAEASDIFTQIN